MFNLSCASASSVVTFDASEKIEMNFPTFSATHTTAFANASSVFFAALTIGSNAAMATFQRLCNSSFAEMASLILKNKLISNVIVAIIGFIDSILSPASKPLIGLISPFTEKPIAPNVFVISPILPPNPSIFCPRESNRGERLPA